MRRRDKDSSSLFGGLTTVSLVCYVFMISAFLVSAFFPTRDAREILYEGFRHRAETALSQVSRANQGALVLARQAMVENDGAVVEQALLLNLNLEPLDGASEFTPATRERLKSGARRAQSSLRIFADKFKEGGVTPQDDAYQSLVKNSGQLQHQLDQAEEALTEYRSQQRLALSQRESLLLMVLGLFGVFGALSIVVVTRSFKVQVWTPVSNILRYTQRLEKGDLSAELLDKNQMGGADELGKIARAVQGLGHTVRNIFLAIQSHGADAGQIAARLDNHCRSLVDLKTEGARSLDAIQNRLRDNLALSEDFAGGANDAQHYAVEVVGRFSDMQLASQNLQEQSRELAQALGSATQSAEGLGRHTDQVFGEIQRVRDGMQDGLTSAEGMLGSILELGEQSGHISSAVDETGAVVEEMMTGNQQVMENIRSMDSNMDIAFRQIEALLVSIKSVDGSIREATSFSREVSKTANDGHQIMEQAIEKMREIKTMVQGTAKQIKDLGSSSQEITNVVSTITGLAEQTNLLALNAAIEAARAGEEGKGFAVVADKVRELAEQSSLSAKEIEGHIMEVQQETEKVVQHMVEWGRQVEEGVNLTDNAGKKMVTIVEKVRHATRLMTEINTDTQDQAKRSDKVKQVVDRLTQASQVIRTSMQEQDQGARRMVEAIVTLRDIAQHLKQGSTGQEEASRHLTQLMLHHREKAEGLHRRLVDHRQVCGLLMRHLQGAARAGSEINHLSRQQVEKHKDLLGSGEHVVEETRRLAGRVSADLSRHRQLLEDLGMLANAEKDGLGVARTVHADARVLTTTVQQLLDILVDFRLETAPAALPEATPEHGLRPVEET